MNEFYENFTFVSKIVQNCIQHIAQQKGERIEEIRMRVMQPIQIKTNFRRISTRLQTETGVVTPQILAETVERIADYSLYAHEEELRQGYVTVEGGHRVGFCGKAIVENGQIKTLRQISSLNLRIAREVKDCAKPLIPYIFIGDKLCNTIIISPPACGKTTLLRDIIRYLSDGLYEGRSYCVGVVDERGEIAGMYNGVAQMDIGACTDVQTNCPKAEGMMFLLRSMSPEVIAVDELGKEADFEGIESLLHAGVTFISTIHGNGIEGLQHNKNVQKLLGENLPTRFVLLSARVGVGTVEEIWNEKWENLYKRR